MAPLVSQVDSSLQNYASLFDKETSLARKTDHLLAFWTHPDLSSAAAEGVAAMIT